MGELVLRRSHSLMISSSPAVDGKAAFFRSSHEYDLMQRHGMI